MSAQPHYKLSQSSYNMLDIVNIFIPCIVLIWRAAASLKQAWRLLKVI